MALETGEELMMDIDCGIGSKTNPSPSVNQQGGSGYDPSLTISFSMVQESGQAIDSGSENEAGQLMDASISLSLTNKSDSYANDNGCSTSVEAPRVGMVYGSWEEIESYYRQYGMQQGFGVIRPASGFKGKNKDEKRNTTWKCECCGQPDVRRRDKRTGARVRIENDESPQAIAFMKPRKSKKCGCPAMIYATVQPDETWMLKKVVLEHNHPLDPSKTRDLNIAPHTERRMLAKMIAGLSVAQMRGILANCRGGSAQMCLKERPMSNGQIGNLKLKVGDTYSFLNYVMRMHQGTHDFLHFMRHDDSGCLNDVLWVDARSKASYQEFGDVVCFDTTYLANDYDLPLVTLVGVNHHGQTILFGCALISHEDTETYEWLFRTWLLCMDGLEPLGILTDQAPSIGNALSAVMPKATHRWCTWQIVRKFPNKLGLVPRYHEFNEKLKSLIYYSYTEEEFERRWAEVLNEFQPQGNEWLECLFEEKHMWVPAYTNHVFWAGMNSLQKAHSVYGIFDGILGKHTSLCKFLELFFFSMKERAKKEKDADDDCAHYVRSLATHFTVEKVFQKMYTDAKFQEVQTECQRVLYCNSREEKLISEAEFEYVMVDRIWIEVPGKRESIPTDEKRVYRVRFNTSTNEAWCDCKLFECCGIMCRHIIRLYDLHSVSVIPEKYILNRWRKDIQRKHTSVKVAYYDPRSTEEVKRYDMMLEASKAVCWQAMVHDEALGIVMQSLADMKLRVAECVEKHRGCSSAECSNGWAPLVVSSSARNDGDGEVMNKEQDLAVQAGNGLCQD